MGKRIIIKGADFSAVAIDTVVPDLDISSLFSGMTTGYFKANGTVNATSSYYVHSSKVNISSYSSLRLPAPVRSSSSSSDPSIVFFNSSDNVVSAYTFKVSPSGVSGYEEIILTVPQGAVSIGVTYWNSTGRSESGAPAFYCYAATA